MATIDVWSTVSQAKAYLYLPDPSSTDTIIDTAWNIDAHLPPGWAGTTFDDSGWVDAVAVGSVSVIDTSRFIFGGGAPSTIPDGTTGWWPNVWGGVNTYQNAVFRQWVTVPAATSIFSLDAISYAERNFLQMLHPNGAFTEVPTAFNIGSTELFVNGVQWLSLTNAIASLVPGEPALFAWIVQRPLPGDGGFPEGVNAVVPIWTSQTGTNVQPWQAWLWRFTVDNSFLQGGSAEGRSAITPSRGPTTSGPWTFSNSPGFRGPIEIARGTGWDGRASTGGQQFGSHADGSWGATSFGASSASGEPFTGNVASTAAPFTTDFYFAQGFVARWTTVEWVRAGCSLGPSDTAWPSGPNDNFTMKICADGGGVPGVVLGTSVVAMSSIASLYGPVHFQFDPPISGLTANQLYWVTIETNRSYNQPGDPTIFLPYFYWACNQPPDSPLLPVVYGHLENSGRALRGVSLNPISATTCGTGTPDTHACWDFAIGAEGLAVCGLQDVFTSPPNAQGTGGRRDPNCDIVYPSLLDQTAPNLQGVPVSGWNYEIGPLSTTFTQQSQIFQIMALYVDAGDPWVVASYVTTPSGITHWGPMPANKTVQDVSFPWGASSQVGGRDRAGRRSDGSFVALLQSFRIEMGVFHQRVAYQTLSGSDPGANFGPFTYIEVADTSNQTVLDCIIDNNNIAHLFFEGIGGTPPHAKVYHVSLGPDGVLGPVVGWDTLQNFGTGAVSSDGNVMVPYMNNTGPCLMTASWPSDIVSMRPTLVELPTHNADATVGVATLSAMTIAFLANRAYFFCFGSNGGILVATLAPGATVWSGLAQWFASDPSLGTGGIISAAYLPSRGLMGVVFGSGQYGWFQYYGDPGTGYPVFVPTGCPPVGISGRSYAQIIGA